MRVVRMRHHMTRWVRGAGRVREAESGEEGSLVQKFEPGGLPARTSLPINIGAGAQGISSVFRKEFR